MTALLVAITNLGDPALTLPVAGLLGLWLWRRRSAAAAGRWLVAVTLCGCGIVALKIGFRACPEHGLHLTSPSGHAALSALVYGGVVAAAARGRCVEWRRLAYLAAALLVLAIAASRRLLGGHSLPELAVGLGTGLAALAAFVPAGGQAVRAEARPLAGLALGLLALAGLLYGEHIPAERVVATIAIHLRNALDVCSHPS